MLKVRIARNLGDLEAEVNYVDFHRDLKVVAYAISGDQGGCQGRPGSLYACLGLQQFGVEPLMDCCPSRPETELYSLGEMRIGMLFRPP